MRALIIDDESAARDNIEYLLRMYCPEITVVGKADSAETARQVLRVEQVDVLFLDIAMPGETGFDLLESIKEKNYLVVFVTAYQEYSLRALKANAIDYLLKPLDIEELKNCVSKLQHFKNSLQQDPQIRQVYKDSLTNFSDQVANQQQINKIVIYHYQGFDIIDIDDIIYVEADSSYTIFHMKDNRKVVASRHMKEFEDVLKNKSFFRTHKSYIINLSYLSHYSTVNGYFAVMQDGSSISVSRRKVEDFLHAVSKMMLH